MNKNQAEGQAKQVKGKARETVGRVTGDDAGRAKGKLEQIAGTVQKTFGDIGKKLSAARKKIGRKSRRS